MKIILLSNVENVGLAGDVASVKNGYFRNYLGPRRIAVEATAGNLKMMEARRRKLRSEAEKVVQEAKEAGSKLREVTLTFVMKAGANDRLFGSVSSGDIAERLVAEGHPVDKRQVVIPYPIKAIGTFSATVKIHTHVHVPVKVVVEREVTEEPEDIYAAEAAETSEASDAPQAEGGEEAASAEEAPAE